MKKRLKLKIEILRIETEIESFKTEIYAKQLANKVAEGAGFTLPHAPDVFQKLSNKLYSLSAELEQLPEDFA